MASPGVIPRASGYVGFENAEGALKKTWLSVVGAFVFCVSTHKSDLRHPKLVIDLKGANVAPMKWEDEKEVRKTNRTKYQYGFAIFHPRKRHYFMFCETREERDNWVLGVSTVIQSTERVYLEHKGRQVTDEDDAAAIRETTESIKRFVQAELDQVEEQVQNEGKEVRSLAQNVLNFKKQKKLLATEVKALRIQLKLKNQELKKDILSKLNKAQGERDTQVQELADQIDALLKELKSCSLESLSKRRTESFNPRNLIMRKTINEPLSPAKPRDFNPSSSSSSSSSLAHSPPEGSTRLFSVDENDHIPSTPTLQANKGPQEGPTTHLDEDSYSSSEDDFYSDIDSDEDDYDDLSDHENDDLGGKKKIKKIKKKKKRTKQTGYNDNISRPAESRMGQATGDEKKVRNNSKRNSLLDFYESDYFQVAGVRPSLVAEAEQQRNQKKLASMNQSQQDRRNSMRNSTALLADLSSQLEATRRTRTDPLSQQELIDWSEKRLAVMEDKVTFFGQGDNSEIRILVESILETNLKSRQTINSLTDHLDRLTQEKLERFEQDFANAAAQNEQDYNQHKKKKKNR